MRCSSCSNEAVGIYAARNPGEKENIVKEPMCEDCKLDWTVNGYVLKEASHDE